MAENAKPKGKSGQTTAYQKRKAEKVKIRQHEAYRLWIVEKMSLREVGEALKISHEQARTDINAELDRIADEFNDESKSWRAKQIKRLMRQYDRFDRIANRTKASILERTRAGTLCLGILKELNEITGVKAAVKHEHTGKDGGPIDILTRVIEPGE